MFFCDNSPAIADYHNSFRDKLPRKWPVSKIITGPAQDVLNRLQRIDVLFYRCDSDGEGGSGIKVLGSLFLQSVLDRMPLDGGLIITDGSKSRQSNFEKMIRRSGLNKFGWRLQLHPEQPEFRPPDGRCYRGRVLKIIQVTPVIGEKGPPRHFDLSSIFSIWTITLMKPGYSVARF